MRKIKLRNKPGLCDTESSSPLSGSAPEQAKQRGWSPAKAPEEPALPGAPKAAVRAVLLPAGLPCPWAGLGFSASPECSGALPGEASCVRSCWEGWAALLEGQAQDKGQLKASPPRQCQKGPGPRCAGAQCSQELWARSHSSPWAFPYSRGASSCTLPLCGTAEQPHQCLCALIDKHPN